MSFSGVYPVKIDDRKRVPLQRAFGKEVPSKLKVNLDVSKDHINIFPVEDFDAYVDSYFKADGGYDPRSRRHDKLRRVLSAGAHEIDIDSKGRLRLISELCDKAGLQSDAVIVGNVDHLEVWDAKRWDEYVNADDVEDLESLVFDD